VLRCLRFAGAYSRGETSPQLQYKDIFILIGKTSPSFAGMTGT
jgi:hypothetical protein